MKTTVLIFLALAMMMGASIHLAEAHVPSSAGYFEAPSEAVSDTTSPRTVVVFANRLNDELELRFGGDSSVVVKLRPGESCLISIRGGTDVRVVARTARCIALGVLDRKVVAEGVGFARGHAELITSPDAPGEFSVHSD